MEKAKLPWLLFLVELFADRELCFEIMEEYGGKTISVVPRGT